MKKLGRDSCRDVGNGVLPDMRKPNRAHYVIDSHLSGKWLPTQEEWCVFHARRLGFCQRARPLRAENGMSRPVDRDCTECLRSETRCEHDYQKGLVRNPHYSVECPQEPGGSCGMDNGDSLGGSW
jgi:hypothetical protein